MANEDFAVHFPRSAPHTPQQGQNGIRVCGLLLSWHFPVLTHPSAKRQELGMALPGKRHTQTC
jgi:hypothetical protein